MLPDVVRLDHTAQSVPRCPAGDSDCHQHAHWPLGHEIGEENERGWRDKVVGLVCLILFVCFALGGQLALLPSSPLKKKRVVHAENPGWRSHGDIQFTREVEHSNTQT